MTDQLSEPMTIPTRRDDPLQPPDRLRRPMPITRLSFPDGHLGWLVTRHSTARQVLSDPRFSARQELVHFPVPLPISQRTEPADPGWLVRMDPPDHTRYRRLLQGQFTTRRLRQLTPRVEKLAEEHLDAMERLGPPVDLVEAYALPIPSLVICELLGVPYADREEFQHHTAMLTRLNTTTDGMMAAVQALGAYVHQLVGRKRAEAGDDLLSGLVHSGELTDEELTNIAMLLLITGHETTAHMIAHGVYALLRHDDQLRALREDPALIDRTVEELLRHLAIVQTGISRAALEDVELEGELVRAGETVTVWISNVNRDPDVFDDPDRLDITRVATGHMSFGHGLHQCMGQPLARIEMRTAYQALFQRFPTLRLAVPPDEIPMRNEMAVYGVQRLPVAWD
ncbi:cytochrome P450 [Micromonospora sp. WMMD980]|uniref:cytochrome P450 n=1 Tax=Micromonospora sp. WMMD980 TaxID=3016088 RepID=UPI0024162163|nr:cytochrome P450 [Micromonospora sp. WMMD980]MDG4800229.1 cytochrome P450 [Micromonospora sp. WMMD980]